MFFFGGIIFGNHNYSLDQSEPLAGHQQHLQTPEA